MKKILASILAVVLLGTMAISGFAAEIVSGTAQEATNDEGSTAQVTPDGTAIITVSDEDAADGIVDVPVTLWDGSDITAVLPEGVDDIDLVIPFTPETQKLGWGVVAYYVDENGDEIVLDNTFTEDGKMVIFNVPADTVVTLENRAVKFDDVPEGAWYEKYLDYASAHGYIVGNGDGTVEPEAPIAAAALYADILRVNHAGEDTVGEDWAANAIAAAVEANFATGATGDLNRQQAIDIVSAFIGEDAVEAGIFIGDENAGFNGVFIRAHLAVISMRLVEFLNGYNK